jgi:hypothetical protein
MLASAPGGTRAALVSGRETTMRDVTLFLFACAALTACDTDDEPSFTGQNVDGGVFLPPPSAPPPPPPSCEQVAYYDDADGDGFGDTATAQTSCDPPDGAALRGDDTEATTNPIAPELCDGIDNDCDGAVDDQVEERSFYADADGDGFGVSSEEVRGCRPPDGFAVNDGDCDDTARDVSPGATELCDGIDQDCDEGIDEGALRVAATSEPIGAALGGVRNMAITASDTGYLAVWVDGERQMLGQEFDAAGAPVGEAHALFSPGLPYVQRYAPVAVVVGRTLIVAWTEDAGVFARAISLDSWAPSAGPIALATRGSPIAAIALDAGAAILWQERHAHDETHLALVDRAGAAMLGAPALVHEQNVATPDRFGASAIAVDGSSILLGVIDQRAEDAQPSAFVHRIVITPSIALDDSPSRLVLPEGVAPNRIVLAGAPNDESVLAAVSWGSGAGARTRSWRLLATATGALDGADALGEDVVGLAVGGASGPGGGDLLLLEAGALEREVLSLVHQPLALPRWSAIGASIPLEPGVWGSIAARRGLAGIFIATGRTGPTAVDADVWAVPYGCFG